MRIFFATALGGFAGFGFFIVGISATVMASNGTRNGTAKILYLTPDQLDIALPISAVGSIAVGATVCGISTARYGRIVFGLRTQWLIRGVMFGTVGTAAGCLIVALLRGDTPQLRWWIIGAQWALRTAPVAGLVGAIVGNLGYQIASRSESRNRYLT
jgi:hypothetical protein